MPPKFQLVVQQRQSSSSPSPPSSPASRSMPPPPLLAPSTAHSQDNQTVNTNTTLDARLKSITRGPEPTVTAPDMGKFEFVNLWTAPFRVDSPTEPHTTVVSEDQVLFMTMLQNYGLVGLALTLWNWISERSRKGHPEYSVTLENLVADPVGEPGSIWKYLIQHPPEIWSMLILSDFSPASSKSATLRSYDADHLRLTNFPGSYMQTLEKGGDENDPGYGKFLTPNELHELCNDIRTYAADTSANGLDLVERIDRQFGYRPAVRQRNIAAGKGTVYRRYCPSSHMCACFVEWANLVDKFFYHDIDPSKRDVPLSRAPPEVGWASRPKERCEEQHAKNTSCNPLLGFMRAWMELKKYPRLRDFHLKQRQLLFAWSDDKHVVNLAEIIPTVLLASRHTSMGLNTTAPGVKGGASKSAAFSWAKNRAFNDFVIDLVNQSSSMDWKRWSNASKWDAVEHEKDLATKRADMLSDQLKTMTDEYDRLKAQAEAAKKEYQVKRKLLRDTKGHKELLDASEQLMEALNTIVQSRPSVQASEEEVDALVESMGKEIDKLVEEDDSLPILKAPDRYELTIGMFNTAVHKRTEVQVPASQSATDRDWEQLGKDFKELDDMLALEMERIAPGSTRDYQPPKRLGEGLTGIERAEYFAALTLQDVVKDMDPEMQEYALRDQQAAGAEEE